MSWLCEATNFKHRMINEEKTQAARAAGEAALKAEEEESEDDDDDEDEWVNGGEVGKEKRKNIFK